MRFFLCILIFSVGLPGLAQQTTFKKTFTRPFDNGGISAIEWDQNTYLLAGWTNFLGDQTYLAWTDHQGNYLGEQFIPKPSPRSIIKSQDQNLIIAWMENNQLHVSKTDTLGTDLWSLNIPSQPVYQDHVRIREMPDSSVAMLVGNNDWTSLNNYFLKIEKDGSLAWLKTNSRFFLSDYEISEDGGFYLAGFDTAGFHPMYWTNRYSGIIKKLNAQGDSIWQTRIESDTFGYQSATIEKLNSNLFAMAFIDPYALDVWAHNLVIIDSTENSLDRNHDHTGIPACITIKNKQSFLVSIDGPWESFGWPPYWANDIGGGVFDSALNFKNAQYWFYNHSISWGNSLTKTSDGGFLLSCYTQPPNGGGPRYGRLIKFDSLLNTTTSLYSQKSIKEVSISPNPAQDKVVVSANNFISIFVLYDATGKELMKRVPREKGVQLRLGHLPNGLYILEMEFEDGGHAREKLLIRK